MVGRVKREVDKAGRRFPAWRVDGRRGAPATLPRLDEAKLRVVLLLDEATGVGLMDPLAAA